MTDSNIVRDDSRGIIQIKDIGSSIGSNISGSSYESTISLNIENPWAGDTETGFGQVCHINLTPDAAKALGEWLLCMAITET